MCGGLMGKAAAKDAQALENCLLLVGEQCPGMFEHRLHAMVALGEVAQAQAQEIEVLFDFGCDILAAKGLGPGGCKLQRQWHPFHQLADTRDTSPATGYSHSSHRFSASREVTSILIAGVDWSIVTSISRPSRRCSKLSSTSNNSLSRNCMDVGRLCLPADQWGHLRGKGLLLHQELQHAIEEMFCSAIDQMPS
jgi:hypothetical protein